MSEVSPQKPIITYNPHSKKFASDQKEITDSEARKIWDEITGDWTMEAFLEMGNRVMGKSPAI